MATSGSNFLARVLRFEKRRGIAQGWLGARMGGSMATCGCGGVREWDWAARNAGQRGGSQRSVTATQRVFTCASVQRTHLCLLLLQQLPLLLLLLMLLLLLLLLPLLLLLLLRKEGLLLLMLLLRKALGVALLGHEQLSHLRLVQRRGNLRMVAAPACGGVRRSGG